MTAQTFSAQARTLHEIFTEYKAGPEKNYIWSTYWEKQWMRELHMYESLGWKLIAISKGTKRPVTQSAWATEPGLNKQRAFDYAQQGFNLAVVAGPSKLAVLDYDSKDLPAQLEKAIALTPTMRTPRGFAFFTAEPYSQKTYTNLRKEYPWFDAHARVNILYELVPLSKTCTEDYTDADHKHKCQAHDYRIREWIRPMPARPLPFKDFAKLVLP